jgi:hypothetical protein
MGGRIAGILAVVFLLSVPAIGLAADENLAGMWNIQGGGTLEIKDDGSFAGQPKDMERLPANGTSTMPACSC